jgi:general secretion pathway protein L
VSVNVKRSLHPLRIRYAAPLMRRASDFWAWWSAEVLEMLPHGVRDAIALRRQKLFLDTDGANLRLRLGSWLEKRDVLELPLDAVEDRAADLPREVQQTILVMPADKVLTRALTLPLAAEENLREVLAFEMDQHTPFNAIDVYYDYLITARDTGRQELSVDLVYSPRKEVDAVLDALGRFGLEPDLVTARSRDGSNLRSINLLPLDKRRDRRLSMHRLNLALTALCAVLLVFAISLPLMQKNRALAAIDVELQAAAAAAREGNQIRRDLEKMADASRFLIDKKQSGLLAVEIIDEVSRILPDHTWVARLNLSETELQLQGQSTESASLIGIIEGSPLFENARFDSPVVQIPGTGADRFHLSADIVRGATQ